MRIKMKHLVAISLIPYSLMAHGGYSGDESMGQTSSSFKQGEILPKEQYLSGYNAPSQVKLETYEGKWMPDLYVDLQYLYYHVDEDGLDLASSANLLVSDISKVAAPSSQGKVLFQDFDYKSGFKVGIGSRFCEWTVDASYTWIRQKNSTQKTALSADIPGAIGVWQLNNWFVQNAPNYQRLSASHVSSEWKIALDVADLSLSRAFYQGTHLSITPSMGLRGAWIRQNLEVGIVIPLQLIANQAQPTTISHNTSRSWSIGPRATLEADLLLGKGFRLEGEVGGSVLFTQYTTIEHNEKTATASSLPSTIVVGATNYNCLRPVGECALGLGWGRYLDNQKYHIDFSATYDFAVFWSQNMMRYLMDSTISGSGASAGNLNMHGLNIAFKFDF